MSTVDSSKVHLAEKDIEDWLWEHPEALGCAAWVGRQIQVPSGVIDLLGVDDYNDPVVVEVKNVELSADAILQVCRYAADITAVVDNIDGRKYAPDVKKILVFKGDVSGQRQFEANAVNVQLRSFEVEFTLHISGAWMFREDNRRSRTQALFKLAQDEIFRAAYIEPEMPPTVPDEEPKPEPDSGDPKEE